MSEAFVKAMSEKASFISGMLENYLPAEEGPQKTVIEAMNYSVRVGGKRLRPMILWETYVLCGGSEEKRALVEPFMAALEMIHTYSLVHDDLPAMDNDTLRRGNPTTWAKYGEDMGVLAGDGLLNYAFETALKSLDKAKDIAEYKSCAAALKILAGKAGIYGMVGGQTADLESEGAGAVISEELLLFIHEKKTAALIQAAMGIGAVLAGADEEALDSLERAAFNIGLAFQIQDDILDVTSSTEELGKPVGSDESNDKMTYVRLKGLEQSMADVKSLSEEAIEILKSISENSEFLCGLVAFLIDRKK